MRVYSRDSINTIINATATLCRWRLDRSHSACKPISIIDGMVCPYRGGRGPISETRKYVAKLFVTFSVSLFGSFINGCNLIEGRFFNGQIHSYKSEEGSGKTTIPSEFVIYDQNSRERNRGRNLRTKKMVYIILYYQENYVKHWCSCTYSSTEV